MSRELRLMSMRLRAAVFIGASAVVIGGPWRAAAQERPWPDLPLTRVADGQPAASGSLSDDGKSLVVYVRAGCAPCREVIQRIAREGAPAARAGRIAVVLRGVGGAETAVLQRSAPELPPSAWLNDGDGTLTAALDVQGAPIVFGLRGDRIAWSLSGARFVDAQWQGVVLPWLR